MNKYAVNLTTIFTEVPFIERFRKAREYGFSYVECQFPYDHSIEVLQRELDQYQLSMVLLNLPPGNWGKGDRGLATDPYRIEEFKQSVQKGIEYAAALKVARVHCLAGIVSQQVNQSVTYKTFLNNIHYAATEMWKYGLTLLIEPINQFDFPGYFLSDLHQSVSFLKEIEQKNVKLQFDFYHIQRIHGKPFEWFKQYADMVGHVQIADTPNRHEPGTGEMDYDRILSYLQKSYKGYIGLEYIPQTSSEESLKWL